MKVCDSPRRRGDAISSGSLSAVTSSPMHSKPKTFSELVCMCVCVCASMCMSTTYYVIKTEN